MSNLHIMLDLETLDNKPGALITEIGAVSFDPVRRVILDRFQVYIKNGQGTLSQDTVLWWLQQSDEARLTMVQGCEQGEDEETAIQSFRHWVDAAQVPKYVRVWGNGASFDLPVIESAFRRQNIPVPWRYSGHRCYRTLKALAGDPEVPRTGDHIGLADAEYQVHKLFACMDALGLKDLP